MKTLFRFLGSIYFTLILLPLGTAVVIAGTLVESWTDSHLLAAHLSYHHPAFLTLIALCFVNILISTLRRWPFQLTHIPFIITHLGLLMILSGTFIKGIYGLQGIMILREGTASNEVLIPHSHAIVVRSKHSPCTQIPLQNLLQGTLFQVDESLILRLMGYSPHGEKTLTHWIKGPFAQIQGLPPIPVREKPDVSPSGQAFLHPLDSTATTLFALRVDDLSEAIEQIYLQQVTLRLTNQNNEILLESKLQNLKNLPDGTPFSASLDLHSSIPQLILPPSTLPLAGPQAQQPSSSYIRLQAQPSLLLLEDSQKTQTVAMIDPYGRLYRKEFPKNTPSTLASYDEGFGGYTTCCEFPGPTPPASPQELHRAYRKEFLEQVTSFPIDLPLPLQLLSDAAKKQKLPFPPILTDFLFTWKKQNSWFLDAKISLSAETLLALESIDWKKVPEPLLKAAFWSVEFMKQVEKGEAPIKEPIDPSTLQHKLFTLSDELPLPILPKNPAPLLSSLLRLYEIDLDTLYPSDPKGIDQALTNYRTSLQIPHDPSPLIIESPLSIDLTPFPPPKKWEDRRPIVLLSSKDEQTLCLDYDASATGLWWPSSDHLHLLRFQPEIHPLPFRIRLHRAYQTNYPQTSRPATYTCDLWIDDPSEDQTIETTLSMNHVHETKDGTRLYLASLHPGTSGELQTVQLAINKDPARWTLTYPGSVLLCLGILLLFWFRSGKAKQK